jgi:hypothetical protein
MRMICEECGRPFEAKTLRTRNCDRDSCVKKRAAKYRVTYVEARRMSFPGLLVTEVNCKCPKCGHFHAVVRPPVREGHVPREYCEICNQVVRHKSSDLMSPLEEHRVYL